ncbi:MAG: hypothetical protein OD817_06570, partial [Gammaproteobacteria bacterium]
MPSNAQLIPHNRSDSSMMKPIDICMRLISHFKFPPLKLFAVMFSAALAGGCVTDLTTIDGQAVEPAVV